ncbi:uncharacterized protein DS421_13g417800 [Arachis hypogaea]|nr:uncharacterized protein DS421_13g417800 [Arachis hypogaea]
MEDDPNRLYRLDGVAHIVGAVHLEHLARLNESWFRLDEPLVSAFVERWSPETHTFNIPFGECTITLQDVAYHLGLPTDGQYISGCLTDFSRFIEGGRPPWVWFEELLGVLPLANYIDKFTLPQGADDETVRRYARAYIMMLLSTQLFGDKSGTCLHIRWLPYVARLEDMGQYSWGSATLSRLYRCMCRVANRNIVKLAGPLFPRFYPDGYDVFHWLLASRWGGYQPSLSDKGPCVFLWMPYSLAEVVQVVYPEILEPRHMTLWRAAAALIYFAVIEWHSVDWVLSQFGGVQGRPRAALNIDFLMSKDGRDRDRWFPLTLQSWHIYCRRFLSPELILGDLRAVAIPAQAIERGPRRVPDMDQLPDVPDNRRVARRRGGRPRGRGGVRGRRRGCARRSGGGLDGDGSWGGGTRVQGEVVSGMTNGGPDDGHGGGGGVGDARGSGGHRGGGGGGSVGGGVRGSGGADIPGCRFRDYFTGD